MDKCQPAVPYEETAAASFPKFNAWGLTATSSTTKTPTTSTAIFLQKSDQVDGLATSNTTTTTTAWNLKNGPTTPFLITAAPSVAASSSSSLRDSLTPPAFSNLKRMFMLKKDSPSADLLFGSVAGVLGKFVEFPFDTIKVRLQTQPIASTTSAAAASAGILNPVGGTSALGAAGSPASQPFNGAIDCFIKTVRHEGVRGLYKGLATPLVGSIVENSILFTGYSFSQRKIREFYDMPEAESSTSTTSKLSLPQLCMAGFMSGTIVSLLLTPVELVKCKLQVQDVNSVHSTSTAAGGGGAQRYSGPLSVIKETLKYSGVGGLYRGFFGTMLRESVGGAAWFGAYEVVVDMFIQQQRKQQQLLLLSTNSATNTSFPSTSSPSSSFKEITKADLHPLQLMCAGAVAGMCFNAALFPADVIKARQQTEDLMTSSSSSSTNNNYRQKQQHIQQPHRAISTPISNVGKGFFQIARELYHGEGIRGFYRGFTITIMRSAPTSAVIFVTYEMMNRNLTY